MKHKVFSIYDSKAKVFSHPELDRNASTYLRRVEEKLRDENHAFTKFAADFTIFEIGEYEDDTGTVEMYQAKQNLGEMESLKGNP